MTLSRSPYSELDKMSLFQDLKLKRRKVDSRCSSDGESLADTNASSPDLIVPLSPKMCDHGGSVSSQQLHNNQQSHEKNVRNSVSPSGLDNDYNSTSTDSTGKFSFLDLDFVHYHQIKRSSQSELFEKC